MKCGDGDVEWGVCVCVFCFGVGVFINSKLLSLVTPTTSTPGGDGSGAGTGAGADGAVTTATKAEPKAFPQSKSMRPVGGAGMSVQDLEADLYNALHDLPDRSTRSAVSQSNVDARVDSSPTPDAHAADSAGSGAGECSPGLVEIKKRAAQAAAKRLQVSGVFGST